MVNNNLRRISLPRRWSRRVKSAMLHVISLAQYATVYTRSWAVNSPIARLRPKSQNERLKQLVALLKEEIRIKDARLKRLAPHKRPHYAPTDDPQASCCTGVDNAADGRCVSGNAGHDRLLDETS